MTVPHLLHLGHPYYVLSRQEKAREVLKSGPAMLEDVVQEFSIMRNYSMARLNFLAGALREAQRAARTYGQEQPIQSSNKAVT